MRLTVNRGLPFGPRLFRIAFEKLDNITPDDMWKDYIKPGYEHVNVHMIFDIKMYGKFTKKLVSVAYRDTIAPPSSITYSSVVSKESVRITFLLVSLNYLDIFSCDIGNAYLNTKCIEKFWTKSGA